jgi:hypothetical protein
MSPLAYGGAEQYPLLDNDLARRVEAIEQNMGRWDSLINSYLGEMLEQLAAQVDTDTIGREDRLPTAIRGFHRAQPEPPLGAQVHH